MIFYFFFNSVSVPSSSPAVTPAWWWALDFPSKNPKEKAREVLTRFKAPPTLTPIHCKTHQSFPLAALCPFTEILYGRSWGVFLERFWLRWFSPLCSYWGQVYWHNASLVVKFRLWNFAPCEKNFNPFTPKSDQFQISSEASPGI